MFPNFVDLFLHLGKTYFAQFIHEASRLRVQVRLSRVQRGRKHLRNSGRGKTHFDFAIARALLEQDFPPGTLSSDISHSSID